MKVIAERKSSSGKTIRLVDDGNIYFHIFTIEEKREYPDGVAWVNICRPEDMWRNIDVAMEEFKSI